MIEELVEHILSLLINPVVEVDVSYFAGGILAHLISVRGPAWALDAELHCTVQEKLVCVCVFVCIWFEDTNVCNDMGLKKHKLLFENSKNAKGFL